MSTPTAAPFQRLAIAGVDDAGRVIHIQDLSTLRNPDYTGHTVEVTIDGQTSHIGVLADEAVIVVTVRRGDLWPLACAIVPLLGTIEGGRP